MVDKYVKNNIDNLSFNELFAKLKKNYTGKTKCQKALAKREDNSFVGRFKNKVNQILYGKDTYDYILDNISRSLRDSDGQFDFVSKVCSGDDISKEIIVDIIERNMDGIIPILNQERIGTYSQNFILDGVLQLISGRLTFNDGEDKARYKAIFMKLYKGINSEDFCISKFRSLPQKEWLLSCLQEGKLKSQDIIRCINLFGRDKREVLLNHVVDFIQDTSRPIETLKCMKAYDLATENVLEAADARVEAIISEMCKGDNELFAMMIKEVMDKENIRPSDITILGEGGYSRAFGIGSKVVKIGDNAETYSIPKNSERFLQPIVRYQQPGIGRIEISEKIDANVFATEEELYEVYCDLRKEGMVWGDAKRENVGRLLKDNVVHLGNFIHANPGDKEKVQVDIEPYGPNLGFKDNERPKLLKAGKLVLVDVDFIYPEDSPEISMPSELSEEFEKRYQRELEGNKQVELSYSIEDCLKVSENVPAYQQGEAIATMIDMQKVKEIPSYKGR